MLREYLRNFFANLIYPTTARDWYAEKGYKGQNEQEKFVHFVETQTKEGSILYKDFAGLILKRQYITNDKGDLDSVLITPDEKLSKTKAGYGLVIIMFQGRGEYYESRFRDMARIARHNGAKVLGFNPRGFNSSKGKILTLQDIVEDGIAVVRFLLSSGLQSKNIIMLGNSLGAAVQEMVCQYYYDHYGMHFRKINSNSFRSLGAVISAQYGFSYLDNILSKIMLYAGWEMTKGPNFSHIGPWCCHLRRLNDKTILASAEYHASINFEQDYHLCPEDYKPALKWLYDNSQIMYLGHNEKYVLHEISLYHFHIKAKDEHQHHLNVFDWINFYLANSNTIVV
jgi:hypothetical protein